MRRGSLLEEALDSGLRYSHFTGRRLSEVGIFTGELGIADVSSLFADD